MIAATRVELRGCVEVWVGRVLEEQVFEPVAGAPDDFMARVPGLPHLAGIGQTRGVAGASLKRKVRREVWGWVLEEALDQVRQAGVVLPESGAVIPHPSLSRALPEGGERVSEIPYPYVPIGAASAALEATESAAGQPKADPSCFCGNPRAEWRGDRMGLRMFCCDECAERAELERIEGRGRP